MVLMVKIGRDMNIQNFILGYVDFNQVLTDLILESNMDPENEVHNQVLKFSVEEMYDMDIDYGNCIITPTFIDFSWEDDEHAVDITFTSDEGFTEFEIEILED
jgi:hypothetical protein